MALLKKRPSFLAVKAAQAACVAYILILTFSYAPLGLRDPATGNIIDVASAENTKNGVILVSGDYRPVVAQGAFEMICLAISRMSAFSMYPVMVLAYLSKCKATLNYLEKTPLSMFMIKVSSIIDVRQLDCMCTTYAHYRCTHRRTSTNSTHTVAVSLPSMSGSTPSFIFCAGRTRATSACSGRRPRESLGSSPWRQPLSSAF